MKALTLSSSVESLGLERGGSHSTRGIVGNAGLDRRRAHPGDRYFLRLSLEACSLLQKGGLGLRRMLQRVSQEGMRDLVIRTSNHAPGSCEASGYSLTRGSPFRDA